MAKVMVNNKVIKFEKNDNDHFRGLQIAVVNPANGRVEYAKTFDTYKSSATLDAFISLMTLKNYIIVAACIDECVNNLSENAKKWFGNMGSKCIRKLQYRYSFVFIGKFGKYHMDENISDGLEDSV